MFKDEILERIKAAVSLVDLFVEDGSEPNPVGREWGAVCPFHDDKNASLQLDEAVYHCFACGAKGNAYQYLMDRRGLTFQQAVRLLAKKAKITIEDESVLDHGAEDTADLSRFEQIASAALEHWVLNGDGADYLRGRGIKDNNPLIPLPKVGYCDNTVLPHLTSKGFTQQELREFGFINAESNSCLSGRAIIPIYANGRLVNLYGRATDPAAKVKHFYLRENVAPYNIDSQDVRDATEVAVVEAILDAAAMAQAGTTAVIATYGSNGFKPSYVDQLKRRCKSLKQVLLVPDADRPKNGKPAPSTAAACRTISEFCKRGIEARAMLLPLGEDPCTYFTTGAKRGLPATVSVPAFNYTLELAGGFDQKDPAICLAFSRPMGTGLSASGEMLVTVNGEPEVIPDLIGTQAIAYSRSGADNIIEASISEIEVDDKGVKALFHMSRDGRLFHDVIATHSTGARKRVANALDISERDATAMLLWIEGQAGAFERQEKAAREEAERKRKQKRISPAVTRMITDLQQSKKLLEDIRQAITDIGYVGEDINKVLLYLVAASARLDDPLGCFISADSGAGKSALVDAVAQLMPEEMVISISRMSPHALYYFGPHDIENRWLIVAERVGVGESEEADYSVRTLFSEKKLTLMRPQKDEDDRMVSEVKTIYGPIAYTETTTDVTIHDENATRLLEINIEESEAHTACIHDIQRMYASIGQEEIANLLRKKRNLAEAHQGFIRSLNKLHVRIPFAEHITFPTHLTRSRRDHLKFLTVIKVIAWLHQHQRPILNSGGLSYIEATPDDYHEAFKVSEPFINRALGGIPERSLDLLRKLHELLKGDDGLVDTANPEVSTFTYRDLRATGIKLAPATLAKLIGPLVDLGLVDAVAQGGRGRGNVSRFQLKVASLDAIYGQGGALAVTTPDELLKKINAATRKGRPPKGSAPASMPAKTPAEEPPPLDEGLFNFNDIAGDGDPRA